VRLLLVRHGIAVEPGTPGIPDDERRLTARGVRRFRKAARGVAQIVPRPDLLLTSPLPRAYQTADILAKAWGRITPKKTPALLGGSLQDLAAAIGTHPRDGWVAVVGHEPHLSALLAELLGSSHTERMGFRKGGCALVECGPSLSEGGRLLFFLPPRLLRRLPD
jgi:phosphohistidine phosphatase